MGYLIDDKYLFSGDAFRIENGKITVPHLKLFVMDLNEMKKSINKICTLKEVQYIFTSHSGFISVLSSARTK